MTTLDELIYYCKEPEPIGALLLTGEWGCGKTYLIDNNLREALIEKAYVLRISLFGITSIEEMHKAVRDKWMEAYYEHKGMSGIVEKAKKGKELLASDDLVPELIRNVANINWSCLIGMKEKIGKKSVILVFDDLERCCMNSVDVLGAINDYCENRKYHIIIIANQEKIYTKQEFIQIAAQIELNDGQKFRGKDEEKKQVNLKITAPPKSEPRVISYAEIKEKIIHRTVKYIPDYHTIVQNVIENIKYQEGETGEDGYKAFVMKCKVGLLELFAPDMNRTVNDKIENGCCMAKVSKGVEEQNLQISSKRPHNIRSLKCAVIDFYRVYKILKDNNFDNIDRWFYCFASYVISYKANIVREGCYGTIFSDEEVRKLYPVYQNQYMLESVKKWILHGEWNEEEIYHEIEEIKKRKYGKTPAEIVKSNRIMDIEEEVVELGFGDVLNMAYTGMLTLDEYVRFIMNSCWARAYHFTLPVPIQWDKIKKGIQSCMDKLIIDQPEGQILNYIIDSDSRKSLSDEESDAYLMIEEFKNGNVLMFSKNREQYISEMEKDAFSAFVISQHKRFNAFDEEMAEVTAMAYAKGKNAEKNEFVYDFKNLWSSNVSLQDAYVYEYEPGFRKLLDLLKVQKKELQERNKTFAVMYTDEFIQIVEELIEKVTKKENKEDI